MKKQLASGFTLIELIIYMGLLGILLTIMSQVFLATLSVSVESQSSSAIQQDGKYIMARLRYDIQRAQSIVVPAVGASSSTLSLGIHEDGVDKTYQYAVAGSNMLLSDGTTITELNSDGSRIGEFEVTRIGNSTLQSTAKDTIVIKLIVDSVYILPKGVDSLEFNTNIGLR